MYYLCTYNKAGIIIEYVYNHNSISLNVLQLAKREVFTGPFRINNKQNKNILKYVG